jgi:malate dehydrogenase
MKISIIGAAGTVGSCTAYTLAIQGLADELVLIDANQNVLRNHAMDINTAVTGLQDIIVRDGNYADLAGTDITIISAGVHFGGNISLKDRLVPNIPIIKNIAMNIEKYCPASIVIMVTNPIDVMNYVVFLSGSFERKQLLGYNLNDSIRFRAATAKALGIKTTQVEGVVAGYHPIATVLLFSSLKIDGKFVSIGEEKKKRILEESRNYLRTLDSLGANRTAGWTTAAGVAVMVKAIRDDAGITTSCSAILDGEYGYRELSMGVPVVIGKEGISEILEWDLPAAERQQMDKVANTLKADCALAKEILKSTGA